ncbi:carboxypeptidase regulatory-like domain-containing protein [Pseudomonas vanderleydeniana]|uniref:Carboxypeptidase regulatory-like domain-containing protein n=1 Tax=Pseudomonas vanderleydeniana TaxID=2745495 RepID=A0A9E6TRR8_9PSED|nr:carboxypeptidase regulatory-like domain-containing protein [Pseudomonas vanderleydeniana]QXI27761.1 carboxypeptidase regulatory-like domain-containing protein [Pseudomonas vanderleydeniana]
MLPVRSPLFVALAVGLLATGVIRAQAAPVSSEPINMEAVQLAPQQQNGVEYLTGGIGEDELRALAQTRGYNLHVVSSTGAQDKYLADVNITINKSGGESVLSLIQVGPLVYVKLPMGHYQVIGSHDGRESRQNVVIDGKGIQTVNVHWNDAY